MKIITQLSPEAKSILNEAIANELYASHLYKHIANRLQAIGFFGTQKFFLSESADELEHYQRIVDYMNDMGDCADMPALKAITDSIESIEDALVVAYDTEKHLGEKYVEWYDNADVMMKQFLLQFIEIQRKSTGEYGDLITRYNQLKGDTCGFLIFDQEMGNK